MFRRTIHSLHFAQIRIFVYCIPCNDFLCLGKGCFPHLLSMFPSDALSDSVHSVSLTCVWDKKKKKKGGTVVLLPRWDERFFYIGSALLQQGRCRASSVGRSPGVGGCRENELGRAESVSPTQPDLVCGGEGPPRRLSVFFFSFTVTHLHAAR